MRYPKGVQEKINVLKIYDLSIFDKNSPTSIGGEMNYCTRC